MKITSFFFECAAEFRKVTWPSKQLVLSSTKVVFISTSVVALFLALADIGIGRLLLAFFTAGVN